LHYVDVFVHGTISLMLSEVLIRLVLRRKKVIPLQKRIAFPFGKVQPFI